MSPQSHTTNWTELALGLYDRLNERDAQISYQFDNMHVSVPSGTGKQAEHAEWIFSGTLKITTSNVNSNASPN